ncbi:MAG TPA: metal-dependent hydrolase [Bryobacteraceae bacterium]|nr:metal-dependent hydrolase [Bryobacteraceae bacterium]
MLAGHLAVALGARRFEPGISLGTLVLAAMAADLLWCVFMIAGVEHVQFRPAMGAANYFAASNIAWSHSLLMDIVWGCLLAAGYFLRRRYPRGAWVLFGAVLSHWVLDWISHRPDMPLAPGTQARYGLGLWASIPATVIVEGGFWICAVFLYARATRAGNRAGSYGFWAVVGILTLIWYNNVAGPPPRDPHTVPIASFVLFSLVVAWGYWMNRVRVRVSQN